ncbi:hypothetical protein Tcan_00988, partial [Toxocara canis]
ERVRRNGGRNRRQGRSTWSEQASQVSRLSVYIDYQMGRSAATSIWRYLDAASSESRQMEKMLAASMERTMKSMKSQLFK